MLHVLITGAYYPPVVTTWKILTTGAFYLTTGALYSVVQDLYVPVYVMRTTYVPRNFNLICSRNSQPNLMTFIQQ